MENETESSVIVQRSGGFREGPGDGRVNRLKCLGNSMVLQCAEVVGKIVMEKYFTGVKNGR